MKKKKTTLPGVERTQHMFLSVIYFNIFIERHTFIFVALHSLPLSNLKRFVKKKSQAMFRLEEYVPKKFIFKWEADPEKTKRKSGIVKYRCSRRSRLDLSMCKETK